MNASTARWALLATVLVCTGLLGTGALVGSWLSQSDSGPRASRAVPVQLAEVTTGPLALHRTLDATLEASARTVVSSEVGGRVTQVHVDLGDRVTSGQTLATLDSESLQQAVDVASARLAMARAEQDGAEVLSDRADRERTHTFNLHSKGATSDRALEDAQVEAKSRKVAFDVAKAEVRAAQAALSAARTELSHSTLTATWTDGSDERVVAERHLEAGSFVTSNTPAFTVVSLDPLRAVLTVTESDYSRLQIGQPVVLRSGAWPGEVFPAEVARLAPVFSTSTRQARVELEVPNPDHRLKPGQFVRAEVELGRSDNATMVPVDAVVKREGHDALFVLQEEDSTVRLVPVERGITDGGHVEVHGEGVSGQVVVLGQQLLGDGSVVKVPRAAHEPQAAETP